MARFLVSLVLALAIGALFLWLSFSGLPLAEVERAFETHASTLWWAAPLFLLLYSVCHGARVLRWYELVRPLGEVEPWVVHRVCAVGLTAIFALPLRLGELVRPYLLARRTELSTASVLGTAVVERVIDGLLMTGLLFLTLTTYSGDKATDVVRGTGLIAAAVFVPALLICILALWRKELALKLVLGTAGRIVPKIGATLADMLDRFIEGFRGLVAARAAPRFLAFSALYWGSNIVSLWALARWGFHIELGLWDAATVLAVMVIGLMVPAGPGLAGNFEYFVKQGLALFVAVSAAGEAVALAFAVTLHVLQAIVIVVPGVAVMIVDPETRHLISLSQRAQAEAEDEG